MNVFNEEYHRLKKLKVLDQHILKCSFVTSLDETSEDFLSSNTISCRVNKKW